MTGSGTQAPAAGEPDAVDEALDHDEADHDVPVVLTHDELTVEEPPADDAATPQPNARQDARRDRVAAKTAAREAKAAERAAKRDRIVEPPRAPKPPLRQRAAGASGGGRRILSVLAGLIGVIGLVCSVILAVGALLVALDADSGRLYDVVSGTCDVLVGPLRDVFSFTGTNARMKEALVTWGAGSIAYLLVGLAAQSLLRPGSDD